MAITVRSSHSSSQQSLITLFVHPLLPPLHPFVHVSAPAAWRMLCSLRTCCSGVQILSLFRQTLLFLSLSIPVVCAVYTYFFLHLQLRSTMLVLCCSGRLHRWLAASPTISVFSVTLFTKSCIFYLTFSMSLSFLHLSLLGSAITVRYDDGKFSCLPDGAEHFIFKMTIYDMLWGIIHN